MEMNSPNFIKHLNQSSFTGTFPHLYNFKLYILKHCKCITKVLFFSGQNTSIHEIPQ